MVIPYLEPSGNYNLFPHNLGHYVVIPYLEPSGNYNEYADYCEEIERYTIPRTIRELQPNH